MSRYRQVLVAALAAVGFVLVSTTQAQQTGPVFSPDAKLFATATGKDVSVFDAQTQKKLLSMRGHTDDVTAIAFSPDGRMLATASKDKTAALWDLPTGRQLLRFTLMRPPEAVLFTGDGRTVAVRENDRTLREFDVATGKETRVTKEKEKK